MLREVEKADLGIQLGGGKKVGGMLFADDFVGVSGSKKGLQKLISVVHGYCNKWRLRANVCKSAVMVFSRNPVEGEWKWGQHLLPRVSNYTYLAINFACSGAIIVKRKLISCIVQQQGYKFVCAASSAAFCS